MILEKVRNKEYLNEAIKEFKKENVSADIQLLEKTVGALYLVESLVNSGLKFIFKGGTSLVLLLNEIKRFSVDVDIITEESKEKVDKCIKNIMESQDLFTRFEENKRENSASQRMDLEHYKFFFTSVTDESEKYILLDIAFEENKYPEIIKREVANNRLKIRSNTMVWLPSIESILGDKLTVLAPSTTGIGYNDKKELELIKQLYDVDKLFNQAEDMKNIRESFINIANREIGYRKLKVNYGTVLEDIETFAKNIIYRENVDELEKITTGIRKFRNYMLEKKFLIDKEVLVAASKVVYLVYLIKNRSVKIEKYDGVYDFNDKNIPSKYIKKLKVIKKINLEAYYYIIKSLE